MAMRVMSVRVCGERGMLPEGERSQLDLIACMDDIPSCSQPRRSQPGTRQPQSSDRVG